MKAIIFALTLGVIIIFSAICSVTGAGIMIYDLIVPGPNFMMGFNIFCMSTILFFVAITAYMVTKLLTSTELIADVLTSLIENELAKEQKNTNPFQAMLNNLGLPGSGSVKVARIDKDGTITPLTEGNFSNADEMVKQRDEILTRFFGATPGKKDIKNMTLEELQEEEKAAVAAQNFELAAAIRDVMKNKNSNS